MHVDTQSSQRDHLSDEELAHWLAFDQVDCKGMGPKRIQALYEHFESLSAAWGAHRRQLMEVVGMSPDLVDGFIQKRPAVDPEKLLGQCRGAGVIVYPFCHPFYPAALKQIHDPPSILYIKGSLKPDDLTHAIGVVGTRKPSSYGQRLAKEIAKDLAANGVTVISGMAIGVDSLAHRGALEGGGRTIAVLGCGADYCYPSSNRPLYQMLIDGRHGAVVSEFFPGTPPDSWRFPARNRIISGMCEGLAVIEAGITSGSLITARMAFNEAREVYAVPGRIDSPMSEGTNYLIASNIAQLITCAADVMTARGWANSVGRGAPATVELYGKEKELYELLSTEPSHFDSLCERSGMPAGELSATLTMLELAGAVTRHPGDWYSRSS